MKALTVIALLIAASAAFGGDAEFDRVVKAIESHYGTQPLHIPFMGIANFFVKVKRPEGVHSVRLAIFEDLKAPSDARARQDLDAFMDKLSGPNLHPMVRVHSRRDGESTYIFMGEPAKSTRMLIATFDQSDATVIEVKADAKALLRSMEDPEHAGDDLGATHRR